MPRRQQPQAPQAGAGRSTAARNTNTTANNTLAPSNGVMRSRKQFLRDGMEPAECAICMEPYAEGHMPVQVKTCGHQFGDNCLEKWVNTDENIGEGTCPTCRGILYQSLSRRRDASPPPVPRPARTERRVPSAARVPEFGSVLARLSVSGANGFFPRFGEKLHQFFYQKTEASPHEWSISIQDIFHQVASDLPREHPDRAVLRPLVGGTRIQNPLRSDFEKLGRNILKISMLFPTYTEFSPSLRRAIIFTRELHTWTGCDMLQSEAMARRFGPLNNCSPRPEVLYLILWLMEYDCSRHADASRPYGTYDVRLMFHWLYANELDQADIRPRPYQAHERFLAHAARFFRRSGLQDPRSVDARTRRLMSTDNSLAIISLDVQSLWNDSEVRVPADSVLDAEPMDIDVW
ncbi:hypothetical protein BDV95DRAFT_597322 [Massariosphaeria phaeospora]|uniref:RING-type domain-containing protein n=1 Tax=Massariosphaeria phaeospora TaxID=100035 RepID=A0A7C8I3L7_9PLEO|nr:hypothetical protein BDV95DRAFT_597322 [Massariosphaeria phaeospora]